MSIYALRYAADLRIQNKFQLPCNNKFAFKRVRLWYRLFAVARSLKHTYSRRAEVSQLVKKFRTLCGKCAFVPFPKTPATTFYAEAHEMGTKIPRVLWDPEVFRCCFSTLNQMGSVHNISVNFLLLDLNTVHPFTLRPFLYTFRARHH
jgi:hypothetical protein